MIFLKHISALEFWCIGTGRGDVKTPYVIHDFSPETAEAGWNGEFSLNTPVSVMVNSSERHRANMSFRCYAVPKHLPKKAFVQVALNVCVESPEMCFLEAANYLKFHYLVELGNCLCGSYVLDANAKYGQRRCTPVTSAEKISEFLETADGFGGVKLAKRAVRYVCNGAASPMECTISAALFTPLRFGGYALKKGCLNGLIRVSAMAAQLIHSEGCKADIAWDEDRVAFEYDSGLTHANDNQRQFDARRRLAMEQSGYRVITFTNDTIGSFSVFENSVMILRDSLCMKKRPSEFEKHGQLRRQVFADLFRTQHSFF